MSEPSDASRNAHKVFMLEQPERPRVVTCQTCLFESMPQVVVLRFHTPMRHSLVLGMPCKQRVGLEKKHAVFEEALSLCPRETRSSCMHDLVVPLMCQQRCVPHLPIIVCRWPLLHKCCQPAQDDTNIVCFSPEGRPIPVGGQRQQVKRTCFWECCMPFCLQ